MTLVRLNPTPNMNDAMEVLASLKSDLESGKVIAFFAAAVGAEDDTYAYVSSVKPVTQLRLIGAMSHALHMMHHDEV